MEYLVVSKQGKEFFSTFDDAVDRAKILCALGYSSKCIQKQDNKWEKLLMLYPR